MSGKKRDLSQYKLYDIIPSQDAMYLMYKFGLHKQMAQIPTSFSIKEDLDFDLLQKAFEIEIERNDSLRIRFVKSGKSVKQYFAEAYSYKVPVKYFSSYEEQEAFFAKDAPVTVKFLKDETFRIWFFKTKGVGSGIYSNFSHLIMDAMGIVGFYNDLLRVYHSLKDSSPLPAPLDSYEECVQNELLKISDTKKMQKHEKFYREYFIKGGEPFYAAVHGMEFLQKYRNKKKDQSIRVPLAYNPLYDKCDIIIRHISEEETKTISDFCLKNRVSPESLFQFGLRSHCSAVNERIDDVSMMAVCNRRAKLKEKNMSGCLAQPLILRTIIQEDVTFTEALEKITDVRTNLYRHADYPYTKARDMFLELFNFGPIQGANSMMFSWIPIPAENEFGYEIDFKTYNLERYFTPLYTIVIPDAKSKGINVYYMYRTKLSSKAQIELLHQNTLTAILKGIESPDITIKEILDSIS